MLENVKMYTLKGEVSDFRSSYKFKIQTISVLPTSLEHLNAIAKDRVFCIVYKQTTNVLTGGRHHLFYIHSLETGAQKTGVSPPNGCPDLKKKKKT